MKFERDSVTVELDHADLVSNLMKDPKEILTSLTERDADLIHAILGISGEAGELLDAVKKSVIYRKELDIENVIEELGDIEFYLSRFRDILKIYREDTLIANINKLKKRYPSGYTDKAAQDRADKEKE